MKVLAFFKEIALRIMFFITTVYAPRVVIISTMISNLLITKLSLINSLYIYYIYKK